MPVIAVLTKYEALIDRVKGEFQERQVTKMDIFNYVRENILDPLKTVINKPAVIA